MNLMMNLKTDDQMAYILITHNLGSARYMADKIIVMFAGQVVETGKTEDVIAQPMHPYTKLLLHSSPDPYRSDEAQLAIIDPQGKSIPYTGCSFSHRCPHATDLCRSADVPLFEVGDGHVARCVLYAPNSSS